MIAGYDFSKGERGRVAKQAGAKERISIRIVAPASTDPQNRVVRS